MPTEEEVGKILQEAEFPSIKYKPNIFTYLGILSDSLKDFLFEHEHIYEMGGNGLKAL
ncbi:MAG: hypothetical protein JSV92_00285 [archaeon]|nr:MAG: hypothetical protein JSV92_00285 [archaeon]